MAKTKIAIIIILLLAAFLRLYQIEGYMTFLGDEGRDALVVKDILINHHLVTLGPPTSIGNIYLGPLYYYMMAAAMWLGNMNPVAAAVMDALIGVAAVYLVYYLTKTFFDQTSGLVAAWLYSISPINIIYSHSSWNPNPAPFFSLLSMIFYHRFHQTRKLKWVILTGLMVGATVQMHYLALILLIIYGALLCVEKYQGSITNWSAIIRTGIIFTLSFLTTLIPWFLFEIKHNFLNIRAISELFFGEKSGVGISGISLIQKFYEVLINNLIGSYLTGGTIILSMVILLIILDCIYRGRSWNYLMLAVWLIGGTIGVTFYKGNIYDHYLGFITPAVFILLGSCWYFFQQKLQQKPDHAKYIKMAQIVLVVLIAVLTFINLSKTPILYSPNNQLKRTQDVTKYVIEKSGGRPFNFALLSKNNYDSAYRFYLEQYGYPPKKVPENKTDQLFVVCEDVDCNPPYSPKYEIAGFGMSKIDSVNEFSGVKVYKLVANPSGKP